MCYNSRHENPATESARILGNGIGGSVHATDPPHGCAGRRASVPHGDDGDHRLWRTLQADAAGVPRAARRAVSRRMRRDGRTPRGGEEGRGRLQRQQGLRSVLGLPRASRAAGHRRALHRHWRPLARPPLHCRHARGQGRLLREAHLPLYRRGRGRDAPRSCTSASIRVACSAATWATSSPR